MSADFSNSNQYILLEPLQRGGMSSLYLAHHVKNPNKIFVLKKIIDKNSSSSLYKKMFLREINISKKLNHPNIIKTYDVGYSNSDLFILMEYVIGRDLKEILSILKAHNRKLKPETVLFILKEVTKGLVYLHYEISQDQISTPIIHRDISPENIMIDSNGTVKIIDFGISKNQTDLSYTLGRSLKGKFSYMSPEQSRGENITTESDVFSLGLLAIELFSGNKVFEDFEQTDILDKLNFWKEEDIKDVTMNKIPEFFSEIVSSMLAASCEHRISSLDLLNAIEATLFKIRPFYSIFDFHKDINDAIENKKQEHGRKPLSIQSQETVLNLYSILTAQNETYKHKKILPFWTLIIFSTFFLLSLFNNSHLNHKKDQRKPASANAIEKKMKLRFDGFKDRKNFIIQVNGIPLDKTNKNDGIDVPLGKPVTITVYNKDSGKLSTKKILPNLNDSIVILNE